MFSAAMPEPNEDLTAESVCKKIRDSMPTPFHPIVAVSPSIKLSRSESEPDVTSSQVRAALRKTKQAAEEVAEAAAENKEASSKLGSTPGSTRLSRSGKIRVKREGEQQ